MPIVATTRPNMPSANPTHSLSERAALLIGAGLLVVSSTIRLISYPTITSDYTYFLAKWFVELQSHPWLTSFQHQFSDYAPLYLYLLKFLTFFPVYSLWSVKTLSLGFDILIAVLAYRMLKDTTKYSRGTLFLTFCIMLSIPTVVLNSSLWGQSDATYALGVVGALYCMMRDKPRGVALFMGLAFAFKIQTIFFVPVLLGYFWRRRDALLELLWIPGIYIATIIPAWLSGGSFVQLLMTYAHQSSEYTALNLSSPSVFAFIEKLSLTPPEQSIFFWLGISISTVISALVAYVVSKISNRPSALLFWSLLCVILVPFFLPRMHERYFYLADIISVLYALYVPRRWFVSVLVVGASLLAYMPFLSGQVPFFSGFHVDLRFPSILLVLGAASLLLASILSARKRFTVQ